MRITTVEDLAGAVRRSRPGVLAPSENCAHRSSWAQPMRSLEWEHPMGGPWPGSWGVMVIQALIE